MRLTKIMAWLLLALGVGLGMLALKNASAQTATSTPLTVPPASSTPQVEQAAPGAPPQAAAGAAAGGDAAKSGSGQGSPGGVPVAQSTPAPTSTSAPAPASTSAVPAGDKPANKPAPAAPVPASAPPAPAAAASPPPPVPAAPPPKPAQTALTPVDRRITDQAIRGDMAFIRSHQARLKALNDSGDNPNSAYHYARALHWVDFALDEYEMKNRSGVIEQALGEGGKLIEALEQKRAGIAMETPIVPLSIKVRDDLWAAAARLKADAGGFKCAGGDVGRMEVQLVWAGHIQRDLGWRSAKPHLQAAERYYRDAVAGAETCPRPVAAAPGAPAAQPDPAAAKRAADDAALAKLPPAKQIEILADRVHFAYDRANISVATAPILDRVASLLRGNAAISVVIEGHADERGSADYNVKLSQRRADAVRAYLMAAGVEAARLKTAALGKTRPEVKADNIEGHALNRRVVFVPSVSTELKVNPQREDLQTKGDPAARSGGGRK